MKILVHIGAGKTGSSSIQEALELTSQRLAEAKLRYLGLMLEYAPILPDCDWQFRGGSDTFFSTGEEDKKEQQVYKIWLKAIEAAERDGVETLIWSNEWMFGRHTVIVPALKRLVEDGHNIEIVCYVRRHDKWARSAYTQWGIKHKTYEGPLRTYKHWESEQNFSYTLALRPWINTFPETVDLINYDSLEDVTKNFFDRLKVSPPPKKIANKVPRNSILAIWAVFNNMFKGIVGPSAFETMLARSGVADLDKGLLPAMDEIIPSKEDLIRTSKKYSHDIHQINEWLRQCDQIPLDFSAAPTSDTSTNLWEVNQITLRLLFSTMERVKHMEEELKKQKSGK